MHNLEDNLLWDIDMEKEFQNTHSENENIARNNNRSVAWNCDHKYYGMI
jgi:hypothetical protein